MPLTQAPKVSVMIPTYNKKSYIKDVFASALMQDYPNPEIIVSDDCSTDIGVRLCVDIMMYDWVA